jgi:dTDP-4-amino-4,6-dideoxygalactose transaminase
VDTLPNSTNVDVGLLEQSMNDQAACVLITHYHVNQNELPRIRKLCADRKVSLYDDCAIALGGSLQGSAIGEWCDASVFSLSSHKPLNFFWAGVLVTKDEALARFAESEIASWPRLTWKQYWPQIVKTAKFDIATRESVFRLLTHPLMRLSLDRIWEWKNTPPRVESQELDSTLTSRPSYAALWELSRKLAHVAQNLKHRRSIAQIYDKILGDRAVASETTTETRQGSCYLNYPILVDPDTRKEIYQRVMRQGFDVGLSLYPNVQEHPDFRGVPGITQNVSTLAKSVVTLPTHVRISKDYAFRLARALESAASCS